ncbi:MAG: exo-alpha-sialidase [Candidatus Competibacteraceae bacterium]
MKRLYWVALIFLLSVCWCIGSVAQQSQIISSTYSTATKKIKLRTEQVFIYTPDSEWTYSHHPHITFFKGKFYAIWSNGHRDEDAPGQRVLISHTQDFNRWTKPMPLVDSLPGKGDKELVLTAAGFHQYENTLVAYFGQYEADNTATRLRALTTTDGENWSTILDLEIPVIPNHGPQKIQSGRLIIAGNISFPYTDNPSGLSGWRMTGIYPPNMAEISDDPASFWRVQERMKWPVALCEGSFYQTSDGIIHMLLRTTGPGFHGLLWATESHDNGASWSDPSETKFSDNNAKFHFGRLPDNRFYYVGNPDSQPVGARTPLVLSISNDGIIFDKHYIIADEHYERKMTGRAKDGEYGYPHTLIHDDNLYVIVSRQKEAIEVIRIPLDQIAEKMNHN